MITAVDTNVLFDLLAGDPNYAESSRQALLEALSAGPVVICPVVYTELAAGFADREEVERFIRDLELRVESFSTDALFDAAVAWKRYVARRGQRVLCPRCGRQVSAICPVCQMQLAWRQHVIADFLVGGHASRQADRLMTRDRGYYRAYFPRVPLVVPSSPVPAA